MTIVECPRDAMQGIHEFIPTALKVKYLQALLRVGFDTLDFGSFVSPTAIPQLRDTREVLESLSLAGTNTKLLAIVANLRGVEDACSHAPIAYIGYPFSISETFQVRNTKKTIAESLVLVEEAQQRCQAHGKELVVYLSMGFGNPYGDPWDAALTASWAEKLYARGVRTLALADTVGVATPALAEELFSHLVPRHPDLTWGAHFHALPEHRHAMIAAAYHAGCRRFDVALKGYGGCPFASDGLTGNIATESLLGFCAENDIPTGLNEQALAEAFALSAEVFAYH